MASGGAGEPIDSAVFDQPQKAQENFSESLGHGAQKALARQL